MSTGYLYYCASMLSKMAELTGRDSDKARYAQLAERTAEAFNRTYWNEQTGGYAANNQAANSFALFLGIVDETRIPRVVKIWPTTSKNTTTTSRRETCARNT